MTPPAERRWLRWPTSLPPADAVDDPTPGPTTQGAARFGYGADYNPEQWPEEVWAEDVRLMQEAGVTIVTIGVFSWARLQTGPETWDFGWLDRIMDLLHEHGIAVDLATATASPPPWLTTLHPEVLPVTQDGSTLWPGSRQHWRPTSPIFRRYALHLVEVMAERYGAHPALAAWHVSNELGCHNIYDYSDDAATAFRAWLGARYTTVEALNEAWGTSFWSQSIGSFEEALPPRQAPTHPNPTQQLDFKRFSSDALQDYLRAEKAVLRRFTPSIPVTTNFMVMGNTRGMDYASWAADVDFVSNDHYRQLTDRADDELSFSANLTSGIAGGTPWFLMEHATSAVNWQDVNRVKSPDLLIHDALVHVAHGADAVCYFQWRQSQAGAEKYHSSMVPHAGADSETFRTVVRLGEILRDLRPLVGSRRAPAQVAVLFDWDSWWASELDSHPSSLLRYRQEALDWYGALLDAGVRVDVVPAKSDLSAYRVVVAPVLYVTPQATVHRLEAFVAGGGHLVTTYFSGIVDANDHVYLGGYPGALRDLLGIRVEEFSPLLDGEAVELDNGSVATLWTEPVEIVDPLTKPLVSYRSGVLAGRPAVTRRLDGDGSATYVSTRLGIAGIGAILPDVLGAAGVERALSTGSGPVETVVRTDGSTEFVFLVNRTPEPVVVPGVGDDLVIGSRDVHGAIDLGPHGVAVARRRAA